VIVVSFIKCYRSSRHQFRLTVLVEQNAELALALARHGYVLETGKISLEGEASGLMNNEHVPKA
jgi:branched-chain amino acid transport system ATP-binding protein